MSAPTPSLHQDDNAELIERRRRFLAPTYTAFYDEPLHIVSGEGVWLTGTDGKRYLDAYNNVPSVGHSHPRVVAAIAEQARMLNTHTRYLSEPVVDLAERLLGTFPSHLRQVIFTCTGSESNDLAIRIAREASGGSGVVVTRFAYHGTTLATAELSPAERGIEVPDHHRLVSPPDTFADSGRHAAQFAEAVRAAFADMMSRGTRPAAFLFDSAFSSDGIYFPAPEVMRSAVEAARDAGAIIVADEVQSGFGRLGEAMWGFETYGIRPDIVTLGKPMGAGHPIGGVVVTPEVIAPFAERYGYFNTYAGNPVAAAAALAVLDVLAEEQLQHNAHDVGAHARSLIGELQGRHPGIADVRGKGLYIGVELARVTAAAVANEMCRRGVLISSCGPHRNVLKVRPPLHFSRANAEQLADTLAAVLSHLALNAA